MRCSWLSDTSDAKNTEAVRLSLAHLLLNISYMIRHPFHEKEARAPAWRFGGAGASAGRALGVTRHRWSVEFLRAFCIGLSILFRFVSSRRRERAREGRTASARPLLSAEIKAQGL
jgi:hypothetical protein